MSYLTFKRNRAACTEKIIFCQFDISVESALSSVSDTAGNTAAAVSRTVEVTAPEPVYIGIIGDVNKDGAIEDWDATLIQYVAYYGEAAVNDWLRSQGAPEVDVRLADADLDGSVSDFDATLLRYTNYYGLPFVNNWLSSNGLPLAHIGEALYQ